MSGPPIGATTCRNAGSCVVDNTEVVEQDIEVRRLAAAFIGARHDLEIAGPNQFVHGALAGRLGTAQLALERCA